MTHSEIPSSSNPSRIIGSLRDDVESVVQDQLALIQLKVTKKVAQVISLVAAVLLMVFLAFCIFIALSIMAGYYFIQKTDNFYAGVGIIAGIFLVLFLALMFIRKKYFQTSIANTIIRLLFDATAKNKDDEN
jgi:hypothetical protein